MQQSSLGGAHYLSKGLSLVWKPGIRSYVFVPLLINIVLLTTATIYAFNEITSWYNELQTSDNSFIQWIMEYLDWLLWPLIVFTVFVVVFFIFAFIANWIAAPFNGLLSEAVERHLEAEDSHNKSRTAQNNFSWRGFLQEIPRLFVREWQKFIYYLPRAIFCIILFFTPLAIVAPFIWFFFNAWMAVIQYIDYPMDNHKVPFSQMLIQIKQKKSLSFSFGLLVMFFTMIPVINIFLMPVAVAGATNLWFDHYSQTRKEIS